MQKIIALICFLLSMCNVFVCEAQRTDFQFWNEIGSDYKWNKSITGRVDISTRFNAYGLDKVFPQLSTEFNVASWLDVDLNYRTIFEKGLNQKYTSSNRWNINVKFKEKRKNVNVSARVRYQFGGTKIYFNQYDADFDNAWRFKGHMKYSPKKSKFQIEGGMESFFNPQFGIYGRSFNKNRYSIAFGYKLSSNQDLSLDILYDNRINSGGKANILAIKTSYSYGINRKSTKKQKGLPLKNVRDL